MPCPGNEFHSPRVGIEFLIQNYVTLFKFQTKESYILPYIMA